MASADASPPRARATLTPGRIVALVVLLVFVLFALQNRDDVTVQLLMFDVIGPLWLTLLISFVVGGAVAWLLIGRRPR